MNDFAALGVAVLLLAANAFFVGAEFALITARRDRLQALADQGTRGADTVLRAGEHLSLMLAAAQLGITISSLLLGRLGEPAVAHLIERPFAVLGVPEAVLHPVAFSLALAIVVVAHMLLGEMVPKNIAIAGPERSAILLVPVFVRFVTLARPLVALFNWSANRVLRFMKVEPRDELESAYTPDELAEMISDSRREGLLDEQESSRLTRTLGAGERTVADVAVSLERVISLPVSPTVGDIAVAVADTGVSRFPLRDAEGRMVGYLHVKDVLAVADDPSAVVPADRVRGLPQIPSDARLDDALAALRRSQAHLALVVTGKNAEPSGMVSMDDLLQYYVGAARSDRTR